MEIDNYIFIGVIVFGFIIAAIVVIYIFSPTQDLNQNPNDLLAQQNIHQIDCKHSVICYKRSPIIAAFSCTYVPEIQECNQLKQTEQ